MSKPMLQGARPLNDDECLHYRDEFRAARYAALADAESFSEICFALESLGIRLLGRQGDLGAYESLIGAYALQSPIFKHIAKNPRSYFKSFDALYRIVRKARNDAMHTGAYARHATEAAIELCIGLEDALMIGVKQTVGNVMVKSPIVVESWQLVAHARQLMLMHSFSFLPVRFHGDWWLVSEVGIAKFLNSSNGTVKRQRLGMSIEESKGELELIKIPSEQLLSINHSIEDVLSNAQVKEGRTLWLVVDQERSDHLAGVLSPFELM